MTMTETPSDTLVVPATPELAPAASLAPSLAPATLATDAPAESVPEPLAAPSTKPAGGRSAVQPVLEQLFSLYPQLFGAEFLPLKLGVFQELLAAHPEQFERESLKAALGVHTRSTRYLQAVAAGKQRHDLQGVAVEAVAPEHVHFALLELFRRRFARARADQGPKLRAQLITALLTAFEASGLSSQDYRLRVETRDADANALLDEALADHEQRLAKQAALRRAFESSGKSPAEFAEMYGLNLREVNAALSQAPSPT